MTIVKIPNLDRSIYEILSILCALKGREKACGFHVVAKELGMREYTVYSQLKKLRGSVVDHQIGRVGGVIYTGEGVTLGEVVDRCDLYREIEIPANIYTERLLTQINKILRLKIDQFAERDE
jgi:hypothetical protein